MDVRLTPEQVALRDAAARLVDRLGPRTLADLSDQERAAKLDAAVAASGWRELRSESESGGPWASAVEAALVAEVLAAGVVDTAFVGPTLAAELNRAMGRTHSDKSTVALTADLGDLGRALAPDAAGAFVLLAADRQQHGVPTEVTEIPVGPFADGVDLTRTISHPMGAGTPVGTVSSDDLARWRALGLALTAADLCGLMRGAVSLSVGYARDRRQYGRAVGSFQAIQHLLADAYVHAEGAWSAALYGAWSVDALTPNEALAACAAAKAYCVRAAQDVCETAIQVHGGIGNTWECMAHVYLRRALVSSEILGGVAPNLRRVLEHRGLEHIGLEHPGRRDIGGFR